MPSSAGRAPAVAADADGAPFASPADPDGEAGAAANAARAQRRTTASPGAIAFLASMLNVSEGAEGAAAAEPSPSSVPEGAGGGAGSGVRARARASPRVGASADSSGVGLGLGLGPGLGLGDANTSAALGLGGARIADAARRQSILSPGMAALFGLPVEDEPLAGLASGSAEGAAQSASFASSSSALPAAADAGSNGSYRAGPAHRVKTPGRSCMTGGKAAAGRASRRGVIFGSPQAAEFELDAAVARSIKAIEKSAAKARYKLGSEPELPFPSLSDADIAAALMPAARARDDDGDSIESVTTSANSARLAAFDEDVALMETSASRNKRARELARARARLSSAQLGHGDTATAELAPEALAYDSATVRSPSAVSSVAAAAGAPPSASPMNKRSRRTSAIYSRPADLGADPAAKLAEAEAAIESEPNASELAPPTPLRRSRRVAGATGEADMSVSIAESPHSAARHESRMSIASLHVDSAHQTAGGRRETHEPSPIAGPPAPLLSSAVDALSQPDGGDARAPLRDAAVRSGATAVKRAPVVVSMSPQQSRRQPAGASAASKRRVTLAVVPGNRHGNGDGSEGGFIATARNGAAQPPPALPPAASAPRVPSALPGPRGRQSDAFSAGDRTADTMQRDALFAMLADDSVGPVRGAAARSAPSPGDLTAILGASGASVAFPTMRMQGREPAATIGLAAFLGEEDEFDGLVESDGAKGARRSAGEHTVALPTSLGGLIMAEEREAQPKPTARQPARQHRSADQYLAVEGGTEQAHSGRVVIAGAEASFDLAAGLGMGGAGGDGDNTYASIDALPRAMLDGSFAPSSPEASFTLPAALRAAATAVPARTIMPERASAGDNAASVAALRALQPQSVARTQSALTPTCNALASQPIARQSANAAKATAAAAPTPDKAAPSSARLSMPVPASVSLSSAPMMMTSGTIATSLKPEGTPRASAPAPAQAPAPVPGSSARKGRPVAASSSAAPQPPLPAPAPTAPAPFGFDDFCAITGLRDLSASAVSTVSLSLDSEAASTLASRTSDSGVMGKLERRRASSIAVMARKSFAGASRRKSGAAGAEDDAEAIAAMLITNHVLVPEREQIVGATDVLRREFSKVAPELAAFVKELDAVPPVALREVARAQALVSAHDLNGADSLVGADEQALARSQLLLSRLRDLKQTHELNASLVYLQWRTDMAQQRLGALSQSRAAMDAEVSSLRKTDERLASALSAVAQAHSALNARGSAELAAAVGPLHAACSSAAEAHAQLVVATEQCAAAEATLAAETSRRIALEARVQAEAEAIRAIDADAESSRISAGEGAASERALRAGAAAAQRYEALCASSGWKVSAVKARSVTLAFAHPDGSSHRLALELQDSGGPTFSSIVHEPAVASSAASNAAAEAWRAGGVLEHYRAATVALAASLEDDAASAARGAQRLAGPALRARIASLGSGMRRVGALCEEVSALRSSFPCRFSRGASAGAGGMGPWLISADLGAPAKRLKLRLQLELDLGAEAEYPSRPFACTLIWVAGEQRAASSAVAGAVLAAQDAFLERQTLACATSGLVKALVKAASGALKSF